VPPSGSAGPNAGTGGAAPPPGPCAGTGAAAAASIGVGALPADGGATPSIVPFSFGRTAAAAAAGAAAAAAAAVEAAVATAAAAGAAGAAPVVAAPASALGRGTLAGAFIISIVPLNFGALAPFRLKPHLLHVVAASGFWVPQFGQNTQHLPGPPRAALAAEPTRPALRRSSESVVGFMLCRQGRSI